MVVLLLVAQGARSRSSIPSPIPNSVVKVMAPLMGGPPSVTSCCHHSPEWMKADVGVSPGDPCSPLRSLSFQRGGHGVTMGREVSREELRTLFLHLPLPTSNSNEQGLVRKPLVLLTV